MERDRFDSTISERRLGSFCVSSEIVDDYPLLMAQLRCQILFTDMRPRFNGSWQCTGFSDFFEPLHEYDSVPEYTLLATMGKILFTAQIPGYEVKLVGISWEAMKRDV